MQFFENLACILSSYFCFFSLLIMRFPYFFSVQVHWCCQAGKVRNPQALLFLVSPLILDGQTSQSQGKQRVIGPIPLYPLPIPLYPLPAHFKGELCTLCSVTPYSAVSFVEAVIAYYFLYLVLHTLSHSKQMFTQLFAHISVFCNTSVLLLV